MEMLDPGGRLTKSRDLEAKIFRVLSKRTKVALDNFNERVRSAWQKNLADLATTAVTPWNLWNSYARYAVDFAQRSILFWDTMRQRGNEYLKHNQEGLPPVLHFDYEMVLDGRTFAKPVNYALVRITPP